MFNYQRYWELQEKISDGLKLTPQERRDYIDLENTMEIYMDYGTRIDEER